MSLGARQGTDSYKVECGAAHAVPSVSRASRDLRCQAIDRGERLASAEGWRDQKVANGNEIRK